MYGYQLRAEFEAATGATWPLNIGQVYTTLARLERDGLVEPHAREDAGRRRATARSPTASPRPAAASSSAGSSRRSHARAARATSSRSSSRWRSRRPASTSAQIVQAQRSCTLRTLRDLTRLKAKADPARGRRLAARQRIDDLPGGGRGPLARPLRSAAHGERTAAEHHHDREPDGGQTMSEYVLELRDVSRVHGSGETAVHALRGRQPRGRARRARRGHGPVGLGQVDAAEPRRRPRCADRAAPSSSRAPTSPGSRRASSPPGAGARSATSSRTSTSSRR